MRGSLQRVSSKIAWLTPAGGTRAVTLALASSTWAGDGNGNGNSEKRNDEVFSQTKAIAVPGNPLVSFDISWVDSGTYYLADRSNKSIDIFNSTSDPTFDHQITPTGVNAFAGFNPALGGAANDFAGPHGGLTSQNNH